MMKFFRKHNKEMMAVLMALLMVVFIGGSALQGMLTPSNDRVVATSALGDITFIDQQEVTRVTGLMSSMGLNWRQPLPIGYSNAPLEEVDWLLLVRETEKLGMMLEPANVRAGFNAEQLAQQSRVMKVKTDDLVEAARQFRSVQGVAMTFATAAAPSEGETRAITRKVLETVQVNTVMLPAKMFVDDHQAFTQEQIQKQFESGSDKEKGPGLEFGYYRHPRVKVQFVAIDRDKLAERIGVANLEAKAKKLYGEMAKRKDPKIKRLDLDMMADETGPKPPEMLNWEEAKEIVIEQVRLAQADQAAERIANWLIQRAGAAWLDSDRGDHGYLDAPDGVSATGYYRDLIERLPRELNYPDALAVTDSNFFTVEQAADVPGIGFSSYTPVRGLAAPFAKLAFLNEGIVPEISNDTPNRGDYVSLFETCPYPLSHAVTGARYVFRVMATEAGRPAASVDEVRDEIITDLRLQAAYDKALHVADSLHSAAAGEGLQASYEKNAELVALHDTEPGADSGFLQPPAFTRIRAYQATTGRSAKGVFVGGGLGLISNDTVDACFALGEADGPIAVLRMPERAEVMVAELVQVNLPMEKEFNETRKKLVQDMRNQRAADVIQDWLGPEQIRARNQFELVTR